MTAREWNHARHNSRWLVAYMEALRNGRQVALLKPDILEQKKLFEWTRAYAYLTEPEILPEKVCSPTRAGSVVAVSAGNVRFLVPQNFKAVDN